MKLRIFFISAVMVLAGGSANAFNFGGLANKVGQGVSHVGSKIGDTECQAAKCGNPNVSQETVSKCFMKGVDKIQRNPNCSNAFFNTSCNAHSPNHARFDQACRSVANAMGLQYMPPKRPAMAQHRMPMQSQMPAPRPKMAPAHAAPQHMMGRPAKPMQAQRPVIGQHRMPMQAHHPMKQPAPQPQYSADYDEDYGQDSYDQNSADMDMGQDESYDQGYDQNPADMDMGQDENYDQDGYDQGGFDQGGYDQGFEDDNQY